MEVAFRVPNLLFYGTGNTERSRSLKWDLTGAESAKKHCRLAERG